MDMESLLMEMVRESTRRDRQTMHPHGQNRHDVLDSNRRVVGDRRQRPRDARARRQTVEAGRRETLPGHESKKTGVLKTLRRLVGWRS